MQLARNVDTEEFTPLAIVRSSPWGHGLFFLFFTAVPLLLAVFRGSELAAVAWWAWILLVPVALLVGALYLAILGAMWSGFRAGFRPSNWIAKRTDGGLWLHLRSYLNWGIEDDEDTALFLSTDELQSMRRVTRTSHSGRGKQARTTRESFLELHLVDGFDTAPIAAAVEREAKREGAEGRFLGGRSRTKHHDVPVRVEPDGTLRVQWRAQLFALLEEAGVPVGEPEREVRGLRGGRAAA